MDCCLGVFGIMTNKIDTIFSFIGGNGATSYGQHQHLPITIEKYHKEILFFTMIQFFSFIDSTLIQNLKGFPFQYVPTITYCMTTSHNYFSL
jgi:hypothetical protein